jgi:hypothetical protein
MPPILTAQDVVKRIAAECAFVDERGAVGIRLKPAAAIVRQYGEQFRAPKRKQARRSPNRRGCSEPGFRLYSATAAFVSPSGATVRGL